MRFLLILFLILPYCSNAQFYNGSNQEFGKNRVQYFEFDWRTQNYERFKLYFYRGEEDYADYLAQQVQIELLDLEERLNFQIEEHLEILLFKSLTELRQSNIGLSNENFASYGGKSQIVGSKLLIYYEDDHNSLNQQIREIVAETAIRKILYGNQWSDILIGNDPNKNPGWFTQGFVHFLSRDWDADFEAKLKDGFLSNRFENFSLLTVEEEPIAGHAFWNYIQETYGRSQLLSILFVTKNVGHIDRTLEYLLGSSTQELLPEFNNFYTKRFLTDLKYQDEVSGTEVTSRLKKETKLTTVAVNDQGDKMVYVVNLEGRYKLYLQDFTSDKIKKIITNEPRLIRIQDVSFPVATFHPSGDYFVYFTERKGLLMFNLYDIGENTTLTKEVPSLEKILSCDYSSDGKSIVISGVKNGQTDIYIYKISGNSVDQLTDDLWDDLNPTWTNDNTGILFSSNRSDNFPPKKNVIVPFESAYDLFLFPLKDKDKKRLSYQRITSTADVNEQQGQELPNGNISYLSDENGLWNRRELKKDSVISFVDTIIHYRPDNKTFATSNLTTGILQQNVIGKTDEVVTLIFQNNSYQVFRSLLEHAPKELNVVYFKDRAARKFGPMTNYVIQDTVQSGDSLNKESIERPIEISEDGKYTKQKITLFEDLSQINKNRNNEELIFESASQGRYKINFAKDFISAKIDNAFLNQSYQIYSGPGSVYLNPSVSGMLRISFSDVMEDVLISGGLRIPTSRNNSEFYTGINFRKKRLDKQLFYYRRSYEDRFAQGLDKNITHEIQLNLVYPFSEVFSWRGTVLSRTDLMHPLALSEASLQRDIRYNYQGGLKTSLVFDNAKQWSENTWTGTRMKVFAEYLQSTSAKVFGMLNLGFDARHSISLRKELIWVNRIAAGTSLGGPRLLYYMGGVDNWMLRPVNNFNLDTPVDPKGNFAYQTLATPMRGFVQNQRNGNSFAVINSELRVPLFVLFTRGAIKNEPLRSFQLIGFFDIGAAWNGRSTFSDENIFNELVIDNKPAMIKIENSREPIIAALGSGVRTKIFGYFVRADVGWGIENLRLNKKPNLFLSLTHDI